MLLRLIWIIVTLSVVKGSSLHKNETRINYRLPKNIQPIRYHIQLEPNLKEETFFGSVIIELQALENTQNITIHAHQLNISENSVSLVDEQGLQVPISKVKLLNDSRQCFAIFLRDELTKGHNYTLKIENYVGILNRDNAGFYLALYYDKEGTERKLATTQFQSIGARRAFPCFDEPHMKARFIIRLIRNENYISNSNEKLISRRFLKDNKVEDTYQETVKMSTYLVAFIVSDYNHTNEIESQRVFGEDAAIQNGEGEFAHKTGINVLSALQKYLDTNFTLNKLDQVAIPNQYFAPGAMENWGMVTYKKSYLVYPFKTASRSEVQGTLTIIAHEYAHHWFGNLVTASWWKFIWLNEGFANYFQYFGASLTEPNWRLMDQYVLISVQSSMFPDSSNLTKPMNSETDYPGGGPPSYVAYQKSGSIIRMINHFLTENIFRNGINSYIKHNLFQSVEPPVLYFELQNALDTSSNSKPFLGNLTISEIMGTWDSQAGYPVVTVTRNYTSGTIRLRQERFFQFQQHFENNQTWYIPINFFNETWNDSNSTTASFWLTKNVDTIENNSFSVHNWLMVNRLQTGYYRVNYDANNWERIIIHLMNKSIHDIPVLNRAQLIDDSFNLARSGLLNYEVPLNLTKYLINEIDYVPLKAFFLAVNYIRTLMTFSEEYNHFQSYIRKELRHVADFLGFDDKATDTHLDKLNRVNVVNWLCHIGDTKCSNYSTDILKVWQEDKKNYPSPNLDTALICGALRTGSIGDWNFVYAQYQNAKNTPQGVRFLSSLGCSENVTILNRFMDKIVDNDTDIPQYYLHNAFQSVYKNGQVGLCAALEYIENNFKILYQRLGESKLKASLGEIGASLTTEAHLKRLINLKEKYPNRATMLETCIKNTQENLNWKKEYFDSVRSWFAQYS